MFSNMESLEAAATRTALLQLVAVERYRLAAAVRNMSTLRVEAADFDVTVDSASVA